MRNYDAVTNPEDIPTKQYVDARMDISDARYVLKSGDTMTGDLMVTAANPYLIVNAPSGGTSFGWKVADNFRWILRTTGTETGSDSGSDMELIARHDDGTANLRIWLADRSSGLFTVSNDLTLVGNVVGGLDFGSTAVTTLNDLSKHLDIYGGTYGINVSSGTLGLVTASTSAAVKIFGGATEMMTFYGKGISYPLATGVAGAGNNIALRWGSPNINGGVDNVNTCVLGTVSDRRLKTAIEPLAVGLREVIKLRPVSFSPRELDLTAVPTTTRHMGLIADEVATVLPGAVQRTANDPNGFAAVDYTSMVPLLIKAIQEQQVQIDALTARVAALEGAA